MTVLEKQLSIKAPLIDNMIEAQNKTDLWYAVLTNVTLPFPDFSTEIEGDSAH